MTERQFAKRYSLGDQVIESGNQGTQVLFATRLSDGLPVVVKSRRKIDSFSNPTQESRWRRAMESLLSMPKTSGICDMMEVIETAERYYVVMERVHGEDLLDAVLHESLNPVDARDVVRQILEALALMHGSGRIHKDLKLENIMIEQTRRASSELSCYSDCSSEGVGSVLSTATTAGSSSAVNAKIVDFDTMQDWRPDGRRSRAVLGSNGYIAPEAYKGRYSPASDVYSVGVIAYALLTNRYPSDKNLFDDKPGENLVDSPAMKRIYKRLSRQRINFELPAFAGCEVATSFCKSLLAFDATKRPSAVDALGHPWFQLSPESPTLRCGTP